MNEKFTSNNIENEEFNLNTEGILQSINLIFLSFVRNRDYNYF